MNSHTHFPNSTMQVATLPNKVPLAGSPECDTWGRAILFGVNYKL